MKKWLLGALLLAALAGAAAYIFILNSDKAQDALLRRVAEARVSRALDYLYDRDSLDLVFCGTGSPLADPDRGAPCIALFAGGHFFLIDTGPGASERLNWYQVPMGGLSGVLFTHYHSDHIGGLGEIVLNSWAAGRNAPLRLYGPPGVWQVANGYTMAYKLDSGYRTAHHGEEVMPPEGSRLKAIPVEIPTAADVVTVFEGGGLKIVAFRVSHGPVKPAYGYRADYGGRSVIFSGDTTKNPNMARVGREVDVMVHEALSDSMIRVLADVLEESGRNNVARILRDTPGYHTTPVEAAKTANEANARLLVYSHLLPPLPNRIAERMFLRGVSDARKGETLIAFDGLHLELPADSDEILRHDLN